VADDKKFEYEVIPLNGKWRPSLDGTQMENGDFQTLSNMRYTDASIKSITGMTKINTNVINATYLKTRAAHHFKKGKPAESAVLAQAWNAGETAAVVYKNTTAIPSAGNFTATAVFTDSAGSGYGRFSDAPDGCVAYCNGKESCIWGGTEYRCAGFQLRSPAGAATGTLTGTDTPHDGDVIIIDVKTYTFKTALTPAEGEILIGGSLAVALDNLKSAINLTGTPDTDYKCAAVHPTVTATTNTNTTQVVEAKTVGTAGNAIATAAEEASTHLSWGGATLSGGTNEGASYITDYTQQVNNTLETTANVAKLNQATSYVYVGSTRPIKGIKIYLGTANDQAATVGVNYWNSSGAWTAVTSLVDGTASPAGTPLAIDGSITFTDGSATTYGNAKPKFINDIYLYWYQVIFTGINVGTTIAYVTLDAAMQPIVDLWDGLPLKVSSAHVLDAAGSYTDTWLNIYELDYDSTDATTFFNMNSFATTSSLILGFPYRLAAMEFNIPAPNSTVSAMTVSYWSGSSWTSVGTIDDQTSLDGKSFAQTGKVSWTPPTENLEHKISINGGSLFYHYKVSFSVQLDAAVSLDYVTGMPTQKEIKAYKFPVYWQNNLCLCSEVDGSKNKVLIGAADTVCVFNGANYADIYLGDDTELTAGASLFSRFGGDLYEDLVITKENEVWLLAGTDTSDIKKYRIAEAFGCVSPGTFVKCDLGYEIAPGINKHVLIWQTATAVVLFDGVSIMPITKDDDVGIYFDKNYSSCINNTMLKKSQGFFDERMKEYHWLFSSASNTTLDKEFVYDLIRKKWFPIERGSGKAIQCGIAVRDTYGDKYTYGFIDTGYMERLEYGTTFDSTNITSTYKTADYALKGIMQETEIRKIKHLAKDKDNTTNTVSLTHYGDTATTGDTAETFSVNSTTKRIVDSVKSVKWGPNVFHSFQGSLITSDENTGYEPVSLGLLYRVIRADIL